VSRHGDNRERRAEIKEAKRDGLRPSEVGATTGADKQNNSLGGKDKKKANAVIHEEKGKT
jgi:hypothetical protein